MKKLQLGLSGEDVSALCLGAMYFGTRNDKATSYDMLNRYTEAGGTFIDTANIYAHWPCDECKGGESETLLGEWMKERGNRDDLFIATKVGFNYVGVERGLTPKQIEEECDKSLKRMGIDTIDLYYAHVDDRNTPLEETLATFDKLVKAGKVRHIGASNYLAWRIEEAARISAANDWAQYVCVQQRYSYVRPKPGASFDPQVAVNDDLVDYSKAKGFTILAYSALLGGAYTRTDRDIPPQYVGADTDTRLAALHTVAREVGATVHQVILAWMLNHAQPVIPLIAASTPEQMDDNLAALDVKLSAEQMARLTNAGA